MEISSFRLFNVANSGLVMMKCFSAVHRLHRFVREVIFRTLTTDCLIEGDRLNTGLTVFFLKG